MRGGGALGTDLGLVGKSIANLRNLEVRYGRS